VSIAGDTAVVVFDLPDDGEYGNTQLLVRERGRWMIDGPRGAAP
jgi:hypothetical protein